MQALDVGNQLKMGYFVNRDFAFFVHAKCFSLLDTVSDITCLFICLTVA